MTTHAGSVPIYAGQGEYGVRFQWGALVTRGVSVYPYRWRDAAARAFAVSIHALLADGRDPAGPSLSPSSMDALAPGTSLVLPSPNGATIAILASEAGARVVAGCLPSRCS